MSDRRSDLMSRLTSTKTKISSSDDDDDAVDEHFRKDVAPTEGRYHPLHPTASGTIRGHRKGKTIDFSRGKATVERERIEFVSTL